MKLLLGRMVPASRLSAATEQQLGSQICGNTTERCWLLWPEVLIIRYLYNIIGKTKISLTIFILKVKIPLYVSDTHIDAVTVCEKYPRSLNYYVRHFARRFSQPRRHVDKTSK